MFKECKNVQLVCSLEDLREIFAEWREEQRKKEQQEQQHQKNAEYLTIDETCKLLDVTKPTLWRWAKMKYLVPVKVGRKNFYKQSDIDALRKG
ncbi:MAG: helix-turn-helix domain-containing protein [Muribaculaceae bacterium]|nr:helix-turn-helix domain-containing protein [Muribaculaceae bacterium]